MRAGIRLFPASEPVLISTPTPEFYFLKSRCLFSSRAACVLLLLDACLSLAVVASLARVF